MTTLWVDIPPEKRVTPEFLRTRQGHALDGELFVERKMASNGCAFAVQWMTSDVDLWKPCSRPVKEGATQCWQHGGPHIPRKVKSKRKPIGQRLSAAWRAFQR